LPIVIVIPDPIKLPPVRKPARYEQETDRQYGDRVYRWRVWLNTEPRPAFWFASDYEVSNYRSWAATNPTERQS
jgi:hypothetical protein